MAGTRDARVHDVEARGVRRRGIVRPLCRGLGLGDGFPVSVDEAGRVALGRHAQRHDRALAEGHQGKRRRTPSVQPRDRRRPDRAGSGRPPRADDGQRRAAEPVRRHQHALQLQRRESGRTARDAVLRDVLQSRHLPQRLERGDQASARRGKWRGEKTAGLRRRRVGAVRRQHRLDAGQRPVEEDAREARTSCSGCG